MNKTIYSKNNLPIIAEKLDLPARDFKCNGVCCCYRVYPEDTLSGRVLSSSTAASGDMLGTARTALCITVCLIVGAVTLPSCYFFTVGAENLNRSRVKGGKGNVASHQMAECYLTLRCRWELRKKNPLKRTCFHISTHFDMPLHSL